MLVGCTTTSWKPAAPSLDPSGRQVFLVTTDRAAVIEDASVAAGRVGGHVLHLWQVPPGATSLLAAETPSENARRAGWVELPPGGFFSADASQVRWIRVTETNAGSKLAIGIVCVLGFFAFLALAPALAPAG